jgi:hypothetical protein
MLDVIKSIFYGRDLTIGGGKPTLNKWMGGPKIEVSNDLAKFLTLNSILDADSGNWETGERHYTFNRDFTSQLDPSEEIKSELLQISRILKLKSIGL